ncbi:MAG: hypothetical protein H7Y36_00050, partial [Armatimonadetes bacterium]|nr:hypothetical protein [Akkermansiaceae bacterium]
MKPIFLLLILVVRVHAQVYTPPAESATPAPAIPIDSSPAAAPKNNDSAFGQEIPMLDPSAESITVGGVAIPLGDNRLLKARFEKYLNQPPESDADAAEYRKTVQEILATISPFREGGPNLYSAFKLLPRASTYPGDANLCSSLAESIYMAMLAKKDVTSLSQLNKSIEQEKNDIIRQADWAARTDRNGILGNTRGVGDGTGGGAVSAGADNDGTNNGNNNTNPDNNQAGQGRDVDNNQAATNPGSGINSLKYEETLRRINEIEILKKQNIIRTEAQTLRTKAQYQVSMVQWFVQRRYEHVLMAARFYNQIWKDGDATLRVNKNSDVSKLFSESLGISPTVASLDSLSNEAIREVSKYIEAFDLLLSRDELHSASQRLMEAYALGEYLSPVATLPLDRKRRVAEYVRDLHELYGTLQARDYVRGKELAARLKAHAKDFP